MTRKSKYNGLLMSIAFFVMTVCIFAPLELYVTNQSEFWFGFLEVLAISGIMSGIAVIGLGGIGILLREKLRDVYSAVLFIVTLCLYIQGNYLNISYGVLDGKAIDWGEYSVYAIINTLCWIAAIAMLLLLRKKRKQVFQRIARIATLYIMAVQCLTIGILFIGSDVLMEEESSQLTVDHITEIGSEDNIVIFVLDTFDDRLMDTLIETDGEYYRSVFADFTRYTDCAAGGATTAAAMPILLSGEYYTDGMSYKDYINSSFNSNGLYGALKKKNYNVGIYTEPFYIGSSANGYVDNYVEDRRTPSSYLGLTAKYSQFTLFKYMPHILKRHFWLYTAEFEAYMPGENYILDDAALYQSIITNSLQLNNGNSFRLYHLSGAHYPYTINEFAQLDETATREEQAKGCLYIVEEYIRQMKSRGVYDNAMIIITSDHGDSANYSAPILFVKERGTTGTYVESDAPVSHVDLHPTLFSYLGKDGGNAFADIPLDQQRERLFYLRQQDGGSFYMTEYLISGKVAIVGCGTETGRKLAPITERKPIHMGETMSLAVDGKANDYVISGLDSWPMDSMVTSGTDVVFRFLLEEQPIETLNMSIEVLKTYDEEVEQSVQIFVNGQLCHEEPVTGAQTIQFAIMPELLTDSELELKLVLATKWCPIYLSNITIGSYVN